MLRVDFFESGKGETIIITFPSGGIGIVDAHPSALVPRPSIQSLIKDKTIHFVCLTHPHADHAVDLIEILKDRDDFEFWDTLSDIKLFFYGVTERNKFPSPVDKLAEQLNKNNAAIFLELFGNVLKKKVKRHKLCDNSSPVEIDQVELFCLSPSEDILNSFFNSYLQIAKGKKKHEPDLNEISAVIGVKYGETVIILGGDALKKNWNGAYGKAHKINLPRALIFKVPHHGAANALNIKSYKNNRSYLELCRNDNGTRAILFAGDSFHPDKDVYKKLRERTVLHCTANGLKTHFINPLNLNIIDAKCITPSKVCNPVLSFTCDDKGSIISSTGHSCDNC